MNSVPLTFGRSEKIEDLVGKIEMATDISARARLAYKILTEHPGMVTFHADYSMDVDGKVTLLGVCMDVQRPGTEKPRDGSKV
jgi:hypothetical protein